jgi:hypothetical protein
MKLFQYPTVSRSFILDIYVTSITFTSRLEFNLITITAPEKHDV